MEYDIIDNWRDLPVGVYLDILAVQAEDIDDLTRQVRTIALLTGLGEQDVLRLPLDEYKRLRAASGFLAEECPQDLLRIADTYPAGPYTLKPVRDYDKLTVAQYVDFQTFSKDVQANLPDLLSVILIPEGHNYAEGYDIKAVKAAIRDWVNVADALSLAAHFFAWSSRSITSSLDFSRLLAGRMKPGPQKEEILRKIREAETLLQSAGAGLPSSTR